MRCQLHKGRNVADLTLDQVIQELHAANDAVLRAWSVSDVSELEYLVMFLRECESHRNKLLG